MEQMQEYRPRRRRRKKQSILTAAPLLICVIAFGVVYLLTGCFGLNKGTDNRPADQPTTPAIETEAPAETAAPQESGSSLPSAGEAGVVGDGNLLWPVPSGHVVTSPYGTRIHPITGEERFHSGMDIDGYGHDGEAVVACDAGVVATATYSSSYGNYIIIDHGNGMQTLYAHMSGLAVGLGDTVTKGQTIGYLGATGWATGTHCHLEVFVNGGRTDPAGYFSGFTYYNG